MNFIKLDTKRSAKLKNISDFIHKNQHFPTKFSISCNFQLIKRSCFPHWRTSPLITM